MNHNQYIVLLTGLPGSGKSYLAKRIAQHFKIPVLSSDLIRRKIFPKPKYSAVEKEEVYDFMLRMMKRYLRDQAGVVIDATFYLKKLRQEFINAATDVGAQIFVISVSAEENIIRDRMESKKVNTEQNMRVYGKVKELFEPLEIPHLALNSTGHTDKLLSIIYRYVKVKSID